MTTNNNGSNGNNGITLTGLASGLASAGLGGLKSPGLSAPPKVPSTGIAVASPVAPAPTAQPAPVAAAPAAPVETEMQKLMAELARLQQANAALTSKAASQRPTGGGISFLVKSQVKDQATGQLVDSKGTIGVYGVNAKFPVSLYPVTMEKLVAAILSGDLVEAMRLNPEALAFRDANENQVTDKTERRRLALECASRIEAMCKGAAGKAGKAK